jgi:MerR family transcriptional regulator, light-induced transcriptional regulator
LKGLSISEVVQRTGVAEGTLRMWERRHGFPSPERLPSGHRRYSEEQVDLVGRVAAGRAAGLSLGAAIEASTHSSRSHDLSLFAGIRRLRPDLEPVSLSKRILIALSQAIEDECLSRAERPVLFASFQHKRFYRRQQSRWRELSRSSELAVVFAEFDRARHRRGGPVEIPVNRAHPLAREWAIVCDADRHAVCLAGREPLSSNPQAPTSQRAFEVIWSVEPQLVRAATRICASAAATARPTITEPIQKLLDSEAAVPARDQLRLAAAITNRTLSQLARIGPDGSDAPDAAAAI